MSVAYVGLGANIGEPRAQLDAAWDAIGRLPQTRAIARSGLYRTAPLGYENQPDFLNCVGKLDTTLDPHALLRNLQKIEQDLGRVRSFRNAPRTIDLDVLLYGDKIVDTRDLVVPHPRMHERAFVLKPLLELDPGVVIPGRGSAADLLHACAGQRVERAEAG